MLLAYRGSFFLSIIWGFGWAGYSIGVIELFFSHTDAIHGWTKSEIILLYITLQLSSFVFSAIVANIESLGTQIQRGVLDTYVTKPIDSQFLVLFGRPNISLWVRQLSYVIPLGIVLAANPPAIVWAYAPVYLFFILLGGIIWITIETILMTLNFWWEKIENIKELLFSTYEVAKYPVGVFPNILRVIFFSVYPIAFAGFVPTQTLLGVFDWRILLLGIVVVTTLLFISRLLWRRAIKNYSSASS